MATSSVSSSTSPNTISALGAGSGVDVKTLAQSLVDAEKVLARQPLTQRLRSLKAAFLAMQP